MTTNIEMQRVFQGVLNAQMDLLRHTMHPPVVLTPRMKRYFSPLADLVRWRRKKNRRRPSEPLRTLYKRPRNVRFTTRMPGGIQMIPFEAVPFEVIELREPIIATIGQYADSIFPDWIRKAVPNPPPITLDFAAGGSIDGNQETPGFRGSREENREKGGCAAEECRSDARKQHAESQSSSKEGESSPEASKGSKEVLGGEASR